MNEFFIFRQLEGEIAEEWNNPEADRNKLLELIKSIVDFDMRHNAEIQACDLLMEIDQLELLHMDQSNYLRVCIYLSRYVFMFLSYVGKLLSKLF